MACMAAMRADARVLLPADLIASARASKADMSLAWSLVILFLDFTITA